MNALDTGIDAKPVVCALERATVSRGPRCLLDAVSLDVHAATVHAVMGENGAGKSTLLHVLAGDIAVDAGGVRWGDRPLATRSALEQARVRAVLPQRHAVAFGFTAMELVLIGRSPHHGGHPGVLDRELARRALASVDALGFADRPFDRLSGGERARVMLARVFAQIAHDGPVPRAGPHGPRALFLDEPTAALDLAHQQLVFERLRALADDDGVAIVVVLHDPLLVTRHADRVALLKAGRVVADGPTRDVMTAATVGACFGVPMVALERDDEPLPLLVVARPGVR